MTVPLPVLRIEEIHEDGVAGERGHREGGDELFGQRRHDNLDLGSLFDEAAREHGGLVGCDAARYAQQYVFS